MENSSNDNGRFTSITPQSGGRPPPRTIADNDAAGIAIDGVDVKTGVSRTGGTAACYLRTLAAFSRDGRAKAGEIGKSLEANDLKLYSVHVHGQKSALASIGALKLSDDAESLEAACKQEDMGYIRANTVKFLADLGALLDNVDAVLSARKKNAAAPKSDAAIDTAALKSALNNLKTAIDDLDPDAISAAVKTLEPFEGAPGFGSVIEDIRRSVLDGDCDRAAILMETLENHNPAARA